MVLRKYKYSIVAAFMLIFSAKMIISGAPVFCTSIDKEIMNAVIMQIELEHEGGKDAAKDIAKFSDFKLLELNHPILSYEFSSSHFILKSSFIEHFKRYVDPYHPTVPTPPPNFI
ncbi:hypothetical protein [Pedobacter agri]|jgi:hypothetical protein|uniref:Uncharacterized protein n=1 Tax=Pedobacter agri TaxID=454586 RepID=A0A9X3I8E9_9SPHI|nr:hypothetical protein [Pedobacter agri]MCX3263909.1 hypothetical protein [Pedobacter agri]MDQ1141646.1 hypothetical protein [Pedobacter agri]RYD77201.1 MAG: hypothetical protein EOP55_09810 [Sphingobacteriales bacterium]